MEDTSQRNTNSYRTSVTDSSVLTAGSSIEHYELDLMTKSISQVVFSQVVIRGICNTLPYITNLIVFHIYQMFLPHEYVSGLAIFQPIIDLIAYVLPRALVQGVGEVMFKHMQLKQLGATNVYIAYLFIVYIIIAVVLTMAFAGISDSLLRDLMNQWIGIDPQYYADLITYFKNVLFAAFVADSLQHFLYVVLDLQKRIIDQVVLTALPSIIHLIMLYLGFMYIKSEEGKYKEYVNMASFARLGSMILVNLFYLWGFFKPSNKRMISFSFSRLSPIRWGMFAKIIGLTLTSLLEELRWPLVYFIAVILFQKNGRLNNWYDFIGFFTTYIFKQFAGISNSFNESALLTLRHVFEMTIKAGRIDRAYHILMEGLIIILCIGLIVGMLTFEIATKIVNFAYVPFVSPDKYITSQYEQSLEYCKYGAVAGVISPGYVFALFVSKASKQKIYWFLVTVTLIPIIEGLIIGFLDTTKWNFTEIVLFSFVVEGVCGWIVYVFDILKYRKLLEASRINPPVQPSTEAKQPDDTAERESPLGMEPMDDILNDIQKRKPRE